MKSLEYKQKAYGERSYMELVSIDPITGIKKYGVRKERRIRVWGQYLLSLCLCLILSSVFILRVSRYILYKVLIYKSLPLRSRKSGEVVYISRDTRIQKCSKEYIYSQGVMAVEEESKVKKLMLHFNTYKKPLCKARGDTTWIKEREFDFTLMRSKFNK